MSDSSFVEHLAFRAELQAFVQPPGIHLRVQVEVGRFVALTLFIDDVFQEAARVLVVTMLLQGCNAADLDGVPELAAHHSGTGHGDELVVDLQVEHEVDAFVLVLEDVIWIDALLFDEDCLLDGATVFEDSVAGTNSTANGTDPVVLVGHAARFGQGTIMYTLYNFICA